MKRNLVKILAVLLLAVMLMPGTIGSAKEKPAISATEETITVGERCQLSVSGAAKTVTWSVSNKKTVELTKSGKKNAVATIKGLKPGTVTVTATVGSEKVTASVTVKKSGIQVTMLDVGQGDAFLIRVNGHTVLVDAGEEKYYDRLKLQLEQLSVTGIDAVMVSHMDSDHMGAVDYVIADYGVKAVYMPGKGSQSNEYKELIAAIDKYGVEAVTLHTGDTLDFGYKCTGTILGADMGEDTNDSSIVMKLEYYDNSFLFTGDLSAKYLNEIMNSGADITADVLKVSHHGSDYSNPILFLKNVGAKYALISVGADNSYGHPASQVIRRLETYAGHTYRTDLDGTVTITANGKDDSFMVETARYIDWDTAPSDKPEPLPESQTTGSIIANKKTKVYHDPYCSGLPAEQNRVYFNTAEEAEAAGYRACQKCHPQAATEDKSAEDKSVSDTKTGSSDTLTSTRLIIGNINSKIYHYSDCRSLPAEKNRVYFTSNEEAEAAGYKACNNCH